MLTRCDNCRYWMRIGQTEEGECVKQSPGTKWGGMAVWPRPHASRWCGDHEPAVVSLAIPPAVAPASG